MTIDQDIKAVVAVLDGISRERGTPYNCDKLYCTTCGGLAKYVDGVLDKQTRSKIEAILNVAQINDFYEFGFWEEFITQSYPTAHNRIRSKWLDGIKKRLNLDRPNSFAYYLIKARGRFENKDADHCFILDRGIKLALETNDVSLIESLIIVLGEEAVNYPELVDLAIIKSKDYEPLKRALYNKLRNVRKDVREYKGKGLTVTPWD